MQNFLQFQIITTQLIVIVSPKRKDVQEKYYSFNIKLLHLFKLTFNYLIFFYVKFNFAKDVKRKTKKIYHKNKTLAFLGIRHIGVSIRYSFSPNNFCAQSFT